jgi:hypothetical protein
MQRAQPVAWLFPAGVALFYLVFLSTILVHETREGEPFVLTVLALSLLAGFVINRLWVVALPVGVIAASMMWIPLADEDPIIAMFAALLAGVVMARLSARALPRRPAQPTRGDARAHRWTPVTNRRFVTRKRIDDVLDMARYRIDTFPHGIYQPVPSLTARGATRGQGTETRWSAIVPVVREQGVESAVDVGTAQGYFAMMLGEAGVPTVGIEGTPTAFRTAILAVRKSGLENVGVLALRLTPSNVSSVPEADCVLCLSVWHHFVRQNGFEQATEMLETIWSRSRKVMFFDTGENEMTPDFRLPPMEPDPETWLRGYLAETCRGSRIEQLGMHKAFDPFGVPCERNLFAVIRVD